MFVIELCSEVIVHNPPYTSYSVCDSVGPLLLLMLTYPFLKWTILSHPQNWLEFRQKWELVQSWSEKSSSWNVGVTVRKQEAQILKLNQGVCLFFRIRFCSRVDVTPSSANVGLNENFPWWTSGLLNVVLSTNEALRTIKTNDEHSMFINHIPACFTYCSNRSSNNTAIWSLYTIIIFFIMW